MITCADAYVGKSFKYLAISDKSLRKFIISKRPDDGSLNVDYLVEILTPGTSDEIPTSIVSSGLSEGLLSSILVRAKERFVTLVNILQANYWPALTEIVARKKKWDAVGLFAELLTRGDRTSRVIHTLLTELYVYLTVMRTAEDGADMSIQYVPSYEY